MSEHDIDLLTVYGIKGSRRTAQPGELQSLDIRTDLVQVNHFEQALCEVVNQMRKEAIERKQKEQAMLLMEAAPDKMQREATEAKELAELKEE